MESRDTLRRRLSNSPVCSGLNEKELDELLGLAESRLVPMSDVVFKQGDPADSMCFIAQGRVEVAKDGEVLATLGIGEVLGELSLFGGVSRRSATARALSETLVLIVPTRGFKKLLDASSVAALKVVSNLAFQMAERLVVLNEKLVAATKKEKGAASAKPQVPNWKW